MTDSMPNEVKCELAIIVKSWRETLIGIQALDQMVLLPPTGQLSHVITIDGMDLSEVSKPGQLLKQTLLNLPYTKDAVRTRLDSIVKAVPQVRATCVTTWGLATALDLLLFNGDEPTQRVRLFTSSDDDLVSYVCERIFEVPFARMALVHLYNLKTDQAIIDIKPPQIRILTLTETDVPLVTGEGTYTSTLHYPHTGNCFLAFEDNADEETEKWLRDKWDEAWDFINILKYIQNTVIDIDFAGRFFKPTWANKIRRYGIDILGRSRWDQQPQVYHLSNELLPTVHQYIRATQALEATFSDLSSDLRRSIGLAALRYEYHHTRESLTDRLLELTIALEALFSPSDQRELSFRVSQGAAFLVGSNSEERKNTFDFLRKMYNERSALVHGGRDPIETGKVTFADIQQLGDIVRRAILGFGTLFAQGDRSRQDLHTSISLAVFDSTKAEALRMRADTSRYLQENFPESNSS